MASRFALVRPDGVVDNVIRATPEVAAGIAATLGYTAREVVKEDEVAATDDAIVSRKAEPGARLAMRDSTSAERGRGAALRVEDFEASAEVLEVRMSPGPRLGGEPEGQ
jgi:hypothetical protein